MRALAVAALAALTLAGCGTTTTPEAAPPTAAQAVASAYARCLADLRAERDRWVRDPSVEISPPSCDQPGVPHEDYVRAFGEAGGPGGWVLPGG